MKQSDTHSLLTAFVLNLSSDWASMRQQLHQGHGERTGLWGDIEPDWGPEGQLLCPSPPTGSCDTARKYLAVCVCVCGGIAEIAGIQKGPFSEVRHWRERYDTIGCLLHTLATAPGFIR